MAFLDQVQDLTSLTVSDTDELSQFIRDGAIDVTNRCIAMKPQEIQNFQRESPETTSNASLDLNGAQIISVIREDGVTSNNWKPCRAISPAEQYLATDPGSLSFASKFNPVYMIGDNGKISVFPAPGADPNAFKAYYVNNVPEESDGSTLRYTSTSIKYFPNDKVYLVVMYAGIKVLGAAMGAKTITAQALTPVPPDSPTLTAVVFTEATVTAISTSNSNVTSLADVGEGVVTLPTAPTYLPPAPPDRPDLDGSITDEDPEMLTAKAQQYQVDLTAYQAEMADAVNEFNESNALYQAGVQKALADAQADNAMITQSLQKNLTIAQADASASNTLAQAEALNDMQKIVHENDFYIKEWQQGVAAYQAEVASAIQEYQNNLQADQLEYTWLQDQYKRLRMEYDAAFNILAGPKQQEARA